MKKYDITGHFYGKLTILEKVPTPSHLRDYKNSYWRCKCECGNIVICSKTVLNKSETSCGCVKNPRKKTVKKDKRKVDLNLKIFRQIWYRMNSRCLNSKIEKYGNYDGRGIIICDRWLVFDNFKKRYV